MYLIHNCTQRLARIIEEYDLDPHDGLYQGQSFVTNKQAFTMAGHDHGSVELLSLFIFQCAKLCLSREAYVCQVFAYSAVERKCDLGQAIPNTLLWASGTNVYELKTQLRKLETLWFNYFYSLV